MKNRIQYFSLTELMLAMAAVMLMGTASGFFISKAKRGPASLQCAENLFKLGRATFQYAADQNGFLPGSSYDERNWKMKIASYLGIQDPDQPGKGDKFAVFHCPIDKNEPPLYMRDSPVYLARISYSANAYLYSAFPLERRIFKSVDGPDTVLLYVENHHADNMIGVGPSLNWNRPGEFAYPVPAKKGYHGGKNNYLLLDGGVEFWTFHDTEYPMDLWILKYGTTDL